MKIRYVVSSMIFWWREHSLSLEQNCEYLKALGFGIELWPNVSGINNCRFDRKNWDRLINATQGMLVSLRSRNDDPTIEQWTEQIDCAKHLNANIVTDLQSFGVPMGMKVNGCDFATKIVEYADQQGVNICIETGSLKTLKKLGDKFNSITYCLDVGYAHIDSEYSFAHYVDQLGPRITHLHLTDNYGQQDDHQPPGLRGGVPREDWDYLLESLNKYDNDIIGSLEMCPCTPAIMIKQASQFLFDELNWPQKPIAKDQCAQPCPNCSCSKKEQ